jgi:hypothetical protein
MLGSYNEHRDHWFYDYKVLAETPKHLLLPATFHKTSERLLALGNYSNWAHLYPEPQKEKPLIDKMKVEDLPSREEWDKRNEIEVPAHMLAKPRELDPVGCRQRMYNVPGYGQSWI